MINYIVRHKNPNHPGTANGTEWTSDGAGQGWTKAEAEAHATRCEYAALGVQFEVVPEAPPEYTAPRRSRRVEPDDV